MRFEQKATKTLNMNQEKVKTILLFLLIFIVPFKGISQTKNANEQDVTLENSIEILKRYFYRQNQWYVTSPETANDVRSLINFIEDEPIDTVISNLYHSFDKYENYVFRLPENVEDSLNVPGYYPGILVQKDIEIIGIQLQKKFQINPPKVPASLISGLDEKVLTIPEGKGIQLFTDAVYKMPAELKIPEIIPDSVLNSPEKFNKLVRTDSMRLDYIEKKRIQYNDSIISAYTDSVRKSYVKKKFDDELSYRIRRLNDSVKVNNYNVLRAYNEEVVKAVNDSILLVLQTLADYADFIDTTRITMYNLSGESSDIRLKSGDIQYSRFWLKNVQKDSLSVLVRSAGKRGMFMLIDDGATISRYKPKETKTFDFKDLEKNISSLRNVGKSYEVRTPWVVGGEGHVGFSQIYLENWKKGGKSSISSLMVLKGFANYSRADGKVKWVNIGEFRNGWIRPGGKGEDLQKNDDKFEITSRFGVSAFKKWFYSAELNYETQFFRGYDYPKTEDSKPISTFMAPARTFMKLGFEYKPQKDFSLLLSPITIKNVYVRDTVLIDQTKFGIAENKKSFWEPGLNADLYWKKSITEDITYETKYKMFINYKQPFRKYDINWESHLIMQLNSYIGIRLNVHFIYDDDVLFPIYDSNDQKIGEKAKLQIKEYFSIGFTYKINHKVMKSKRIR